jgi:metallo-beta-lactamase class B
VQALIDAARAAAGSEWQEALQFICAADANRANRPDDPLVPPTRVFDNLVAIGRSGTMVWAITTPDGIMLIDAGYADQLDSVLLPGLRAVGLDPASVRYVFLGHGHADHFGGAAYFQDRGARVVLSAEDWDLLGAAPVPAAGGAAAAPAVRAPRRDVVAVEGQAITFGGVGVTPIRIPGHTAGSLGYVFPVRDGASTHTAALFGGSILIPGRLPDASLQQYIASVEHFAAETRRLGADVELQNHPLYDGLIGKLDRLRARRSGQPHPFVVGVEAYQRFLQVMATCTRAQIARRAIK